MKKENILLINPSQTKIFGTFKAPNFIPIGLGYLGAALIEKGYNVKILDIDAENIDNHKLLDIIQSFKPMAVGITATTPIINEALSISRAVKCYSKEIYTILGGVHPTLVPDKVISDSSVDFVVRGEGEKTIIELIGVLKSKTDLTNIHGITFRQDYKIISNPPRQPLENLDELPWPARDLFDQDKYGYPGALYIPTIPIITSRGCPYNCTFCCIKTLSRKFRYRSAENVVNEIELLVKKYGAKEIHIWDDNFILKRDRVFEIEKLIKNKKIDVLIAFPNGVRVNHVDEEILNSLKNIGTYSVCFGVESGNQNILNNIKKGTTTQQIRKAFSLARKMGFETWAFFIFGLPGETKGTLRETIRFAKSLDTDIAKFHILKPYPGTEVFDYFHGKGLIENYDYACYGTHTEPVHRLPGLSREDLLYWYKRAYREFYLRPEIVVRQILALKTWTRIKATLQCGFSLLLKMCNNSKINSRSK